MSGRYCSRKHTPITSESQRGLFGAVAGGSSRIKVPGLSKAEAKRHLKEVSGKRLPRYRRRKR